MVTLQRKIFVKVFPRSKSNSVKIEKDIYGNDIYCVSVMELPLEGKANKAVIETLSVFFSVPKTFVKISKGENQSYKICEIYGSD